jgi:hypothetical protein
MKKQSLEILHRYRNHLLERAQAGVQDKMAEENNQKARILHLRERMQEAHRAKLQSTCAGDLVSLDEAASYLHGRTTLAYRALSVARLAREEALDQLLELKKERDQISHLIDKERAARRQAQDESERIQLNDFATRYASIARP